MRLICFQSAISAENRPAEQRRQAGGDLHHQNAECPAIHTPPQPTAHCNTEFARPFVSENDPRCLVSAPVSAPAFNILHEIIGNGHRASRYARMNGPSHPDKYTTIRRKLADAQLERHIAGDETIAPILIGADGLASAGLCEQDAGGLDRARRILEAGQVCGVTMAAIVCKGGDGHDGCHPWALYAGRYDPAAIRYQMQQVATLAGASTDELYPSGKAIRAPGGKHLLTLDFGTGLLNSGELFDLNDADERAAFFAAWYALPRNPRPPDPPKAEPVQRSYDATKSGARGIADFNRTHDLQAMMEADGYDFDERGASPYDCGSHDRKNNRPMQIFKAKDGTHKAQSYSPDCKVALAFRSGKVLDAFGYEAYRQGLTSDDLAARMWPPVEPKVSNVTFVTPAQRAARQRDAKRKKAARKQAAADLRADVMGRAACDEAMPHCAHHQLDIHLQIADTRGWHRASVARQAELAGYSERWTQIANRYLVEHGYLTRQETSGATTAIWTFTRSPDRSPVETSNAAVEVRENANGSPVLNHEHAFYEEPVHACERRPAPTPERACEADDLDGWAWCDDRHGGEELTALENPAHIRAGSDAEQLAVADRILTMTADELAAWVASHAAPDDPPARSWACPGCNQLDQVDAGGASYDPNAPLPPADPRAVPSWLRVAGDIAMERREDVGDAPQVEIPKVSEFDDPDPLVRCPPTDPATAQQYHKLRGAARKATSSEQRRFLLDKAAALEEWRPASEAIGRRSQAKPTRGPPRAAGPSTAFGPLFAGGGT